MIEHAENKAIENPPAKKMPTRKYFFPKLGKTVEASSLKEAQKIISSKK